MPLCARCGEVSRVLCMRSAEWRSYHREWARAGGGDGWGTKMRVVYQWRQGGNTSPRWAWKPRRTDTKTQRILMALYDVDLKRGLTASQFGIWNFVCVWFSNMGMDRRRRASLALTLNFIALLFAVSALTSSYWCEGTRKVVKPFCTGPVTTKQTYCIRFNSSNLNDTRLVQYIWETGEDKFVMRKFHSGIWFSCEQNVNMIGENLINLVLLTTYLRQYLRTQRIEDD